MGKIKKRNSLKWSFIKYIPICLVFSWMGVYFIGIETNRLQDWYEERHKDIRLTPSLYRVEFEYDEEGDAAYWVADDNRRIDKKTHRYQMVYWFISYGQGLWMALWVLFCIAATGWVFYSMELKKPIAMLMDASRKISENNLNFSLRYEKDNEMGLLCRSFEEMRRELDRNNREMWNLLEERKQLNRAFSHDLRTPLTVLRGYTDFLTQYVPEGKVSSEKVTEILAMMSGQVERLENYTAKMTDIQQLSELTCCKKCISVKELLDKMEKSGEMLGREKEFCFHAFVTEKTLFLDEELVMEVYENLVSNGVRFAKTGVVATARFAEGKFLVSVEDDGDGFSEEAMKRATEPFYRGDKDNDKEHFGMGLYICKILCERCEGWLTVENGSMGGKVTAFF